MSEIRIEDRIAIGAATLEVWHAIEDPVIRARWHPFVTEIAGEHSLGQVRTCSVLVGRRHGETKERCVVEEPGSSIVWLVEEDSTGFGRMVSNWRAGFALTDRGDATVVAAESIFEPNNLLVRAMLPIVRRKFTRPSGPSWRR
jgi:Polyketide cyclase / dehydrase and lipid transport